MFKGLLAASESIRKVVMVTVATGITLAGLGLLASGGYRMIAASDQGRAAPILSQVSAQEPTPDVSPDVAPIPSVVPTVPDMGFSAQASEVTNAQPTTPSRQLVVPTATRVLRATSTPVPAATELPDTGFGSVLQPLAGAGLVSIAFLARALRKRQ